MVLDLVKLFLLSAGLHLEFLGILVAPLLKEILGHLVFKLSRLRDSVELVREGNVLES